MQTFLNTQQIELSNQQLFGSIFNNDIVIIQGQVGKVIDVISIVCEYVHGNTSYNIGKGKFKLGNIQNTNDYQYSGEAFPGTSTFTKVNLDYSNNSLPINAPLVFTPSLGNMQGDGTLKISVIYRYV